MHSEKYAILIMYYRNSSVIVDLAI